MLNRYFFALAILLLAPHSVQAKETPATSNYSFLTTSDAEDRRIPILAEDSDPLLNAFAKTKPKMPRDNYLTSYVGIYNNADYTPLIDLINAAKESIDIEIYEMNDEDFMSALHEALDRGVQVRVVKDPSPVGSRCDLFNSSPGSNLPPDEEPTNDKNCAAQKKLANEIRNAPGSFFLPFVKDELCGQSDNDNNGNSRGNCFQHGKMVAIDKTVALISTGNFNTTSLCNLNNKPSRCNRDFSYVTRDPVVIEGLTTVMENDSRGRRYDLKGYLDSNSQLTSKATISPFSSDPLIELANSARKVLRVQNQYMKEPKWNEALKAAARRGVKVELMQASACAFAKPSPSEAKKLSALYQDLESAGIELRFFTSSMRLKGKEGYLHAKVMIADDTTAWVGSVNGSDSAVNANREFGIFFNHPSRIDQLKDVVTQDFHATGSETWQETLNCAKDTNSPDLSL